MSEIESKGKGAQEEKKTEEGKDGKPLKDGEASDGEDDKKEKKKKKKKDAAEAGEEDGAEKKKKKKDAEEEEEEPAQEEGLKLDSDEIGKSQRLLSHTLNDEYLVTTTDILNDYNWFCNPDTNFVFKSFSSLTLI